ncbi:hypothetical protein MKW92_033326 [Papaver armeniacum]|nr:hypothetical protein MKW92_033326 [Papaver armeniacum]
MKEEFLIDMEHFYLNNLATLSVHPPDVKPTHAAYLNALHDVHQLYGRFSDDEENDYYPEADSPEATNPPSPDIAADSAFGPASSNSSLEIVNPIDVHVVDSCNPTDIFVAGGAFEAISTINTITVGANSFEGNVQEDVGSSTVVCAAVTSGERVFETNPYPREVDVVVISSSEDKA